MFLDFYKIDTSGKHPFCNQTPLCVTALLKTGGENSSEEARRLKKSSTIPFLTEKSLIVCESFYFCNIGNQPKGGGQCTRKKKDPVSDALKSDG